MTGTTVVHPDDVEPERGEGDTAESRVTFSGHLEQRLIRFELCERVRRIGL